ncbi:methyl-accepting chemotaxis protein [Paenibacillus albiflavus]|nr:methyl-accepting chemotaxis protein [Paenibacillus albiflavus]
MLKQDKNRIMLILSIGVMGLSAVVHLLHRVYNIFGDYLFFNKMNAVPGRFLFLLNIIFTIPILLGLISVVITFTNSRYKKYLPLLNTLTLTFGSISIIAGGNGMVEYHFSIFMVIAAISYYESIPLILISTVIFAVQHFAGYFFAPELLCGTSNYHFGLLMIHAIFLILTSGATILQVYTKKKYTLQLEKENEIKAKDLKHILSNIAVASKQIIDTSTTLSINIKKSTMESQNIVDTMQQVTTTAQQQASATKESATAMNEMSTGIQKVAETSNYISEHSRSTVQVAKNGDKIVESAVVQMSTINQSVQELSDTIMMLRERTDKIDEIVQVIGSISRQTNLLSLNAAIEAARAGENGKGFAVVAGEVRKLAEQSQESAKEIAELIHEIHVSTDATVEVMIAGIHNVSTGIKVIHEVGQSFENIVKDSELIASQIEEMSAIAEEMSASSQQVSASVEEVSAIAEHNESAASMVAHSMEEQQKGIEMILDVSDTLMKLADELEDLVAKFSH